MQKAKILLVDDEKVALANLEYVLAKEGYEVTVADSGSTALELLSDSARNGGFDLVLTDLRMPRVDGMEVLRYTRSVLPYTEVIVITGYATVDSAIQALQAGAYHYVSKPIKLDEVRSLVRKALAKRDLRLENLRLRERLERMQGRAIVTEDPQMRHLLQEASQVAQSDCAVLISGESGTGKELFARFLHDCSPRAAGPFKAVNCGVFSEQLLASELFGHEKGAFTGADLKKTGLVTAAGGGTLFLDEITEMSPAMQVMLLRVLQEREVRPVGATNAVPVNVRFLASTNQDIRKLGASGEFRQDLYFRINVMHFHLPPLAERRGDIPLLVQYFIGKHCGRMNKPECEISADASQKLRDYGYPGNVRELENIIERAVVMAGSGRIESRHLPDLLGQTFRARWRELLSLEEQERQYIEWVLEQTRGNRTQAAEILGIDRVSLWRRLKKSGGGAVPEETGMGPRSS